MISPKRIPNCESNFTGYTIEDESISSGIRDEEVQDISSKILPLFTNNWTDKEKELIDKLRQEVKDYVFEFNNELTEYYATDYFYARWLVARAWDIPQSVELFINAMNWRKENDIMTLVDRFEKSEYFALCFEYWPSTLARKTNFWTYDNSVVLFDRLGTIDPSILDVIPMEVILDYHIYIAEVLERKHAKIVKRYGWTPGNIMVEDLTGLGTSFLAPRMQELLKRISHIDQNYYPLTLRRAILINTPMVFDVIWGIVKNFFDERVQRKIEVFGSDQKQIELYLKQIIPPCFILDTFGGDCKYKIPAAGPGREFGKEIPMKGGQTRKVMVGRNSIYEHMITLKNKTTIVWSFTSDAELKFGILKEENGRKKEVVKLERKQAHKEKVEGRYEAIPGRYYFTIINEAYIFEASAIYHLTW